MAKKRYDNEQVSSNDIVSFLSKSSGLLPPQALDLEEAVLGALMIEKEAIHDVGEILRPESFYSDIHQTIYRAILELSHKQQPIDLYTVAEMLKRSDNLELVGGASHLAELTEKVGSASHVEFHAKIIAQKYIQRELIKASAEIQRDSFDDSVDITDLIDQAEGKIFKVSEGHIKRDVRESRDVVRSALAMIEEARSKPDGLNGVPTGLNALDKITSGWQPTDLIIIAARPSMGKTAFVLSMARNITVDFNRPMAFFSLEMGAEQLITRLIISESGLDGQKVKNGKLDAQEWEYLQKQIKPLENAPLLIDDTPALSIFEFRSKARRLSAQYGIQLIVIDYLQLMTGPSDTKGNREQEVAAISRSLKAIAKELKIPIIALSQLNRSVEIRGGNKRPQLSDLRESGAIEQDADIVAFIHRPEYYKQTHDEENNPIRPGTAEIIIAKHRNGSTDTANLYFKKEQAKFTNFENDDMPDFSNSTSVESSSWNGDDNNNSQSGLESGINDFENSDLAPF